MTRGQQHGNSMSYDADGVASFTIVEVQERAVVTVSGEIDLYSSPTFREALEAAARRSDRLIVDLTDVPFLDSTGMRVLTETLHRHRPERDVLVCLVGLAPMVRQVLEITGLIKLFPVFTTMTEALADTTPPD
jgi:anti-sigma B factor antagonist